MQSGSVGVTFLSRDILIGVFLVLVVLIDSVDEIEANDLMPSTASTYSLLNLTFERVTSD